MTLASAGCEVVGLGTDTSCNAFLEALANHRAEILALSRRLIAGIVQTRAVTDRMHELHIREAHIVLVGGAPFTEEFSKAVGADAYCRDATSCAETARSLLAAQSAEAAHRLCGLRDGACTALRAGLG